MTQKITPIKSPVIIAAIATATSVFTHAPAAVDDNDPPPLALAQSAVRAVVLTVAFTPPQCNRLGGVAAAALAATSATLQIAGKQDTDGAMKKTFSGFNAGIMLSQSRRTPENQKQDNNVIERIAINSVGGWHDHAINTEQDEAAKAALHKHIRSFISSARAIIAQRRA